MTSFAVFCFGVLCGILLGSSARQLLPNICSLLIGVYGLLVSVVVGGTCRLDLDFSARWAVREASLIWWQGVLL